jgi:predicted Zn-ribbon and HTH transcriptional regulator
MTAPSTLRDVLDKNLGDLGLIQKARKYQVYMLWHSIVGEIAQNAFPRRIDGDVLYVATSSSVWSQELTFMATSILGKVNHALGGAYFRDIRFSEHLWRQISKAEGHYVRRVRRKQERRTRRSSADVDGDLSEVFSRLRETMRHRVSSLAAKGYRSCPRCGYFFPEIKKECPMCKARREFYVYKQAVAVLGERPYLTNQAVCQALSITDEWLVERARTELESCWIGLIRSGLSQAPRRQRRPAHVTEAGTKLASLRSGKKAEDIRERDMSTILGVRLAAILRKE